MSYDNILIECVEENSRSLRRKKQETVCKDCLDCSYIKILKVEGPKKPADCGNSTIPPEWHNDDLFHR